MSLYIAGTIVSWKLSLSIVVDPFVAHDASTKLSLSIQVAKKASTKLSSYIVPLTKAVQRPTLTKLSLPITGATASLKLILSIVVDPVAISASTKLSLSIAASKKSSSDHNSNFVNIQYTFYNNKNRFDTFQGNGSSQKTYGISQTKC